MSSRSALAPLFVSAAILLIAVACVESGGPASSGGGVEEQVMSAPEASAEDSSSRGPAPVEPESEAPAEGQPLVEQARSESPKPRFLGFDFRLNEGAFWEYRWETKSSYFAARGSSSDSDSGAFRVTLGAPKEIHGVTAYEVNVSGKHQVTDEDRSFAPRWRYIAVANDQMLISGDGETLVVLFDARAGEWPGSGFFTTRMKPETLYEARDGRIPQPVSDWPGVQEGSALSVSHSADKSKCQTYRVTVKSGGPLGTICGDDSLSYSEREMYLAGIGPVAYSYSFSMSRGSGMNSWSSSASEHLALVASSLRGDAASSGSVPSPSGSETPEPVVATLQPTPPLTARPRRPQPVVRPSTARRLPAPGGRVAFSSDRDGNDEIYLVNTDGSGLTRLTVNRLNDTSPAFSPDGSRIAFTADRDGARDIFVMDANSGANQTNLTNDSAHDHRPSWSPDGRKITFNSHREGFNIFVVNADGSDQTRLTKTEGIESQDASWSPDGSKIAFYTYRGNGDIFLMNPDGSGETRLTKSPHDDLTPSWSPDGSRIAFTSYRDGNPEIYVINVDGSGETRLTNDLGADWSPSWSQDGARIAFESERDGNRNIYVINADGSGLMRLTDDPAQDASPSWAPR